MKRRVTRTLSLEGARPKRCEEPKTSCSVAGCPEPTNGRKPYCLVHLDRLPYVRKIRAELARFQATGIDPAALPSPPRAAAG